MILILDLLLNFKTQKLVLNRRKELLLICISVLCTSFSLRAQQPPKNTHYQSHFNLGLGYGIGYGVIGFRLTYLPIKQVGIIFSGGHCLVGAVKTTGLIVRILPNRTLCPYLTTLLGYYTVNHSGSLSKYHFGPTASAGLEIWTPKRRNFLSFELFAPLHSNDWNKLNNDPDFTLKTFPPNLFSVGFHWVPR